MTPQEIEDIFHAQTKNVRELDAAWRHINRTINDALRNDNSKLASFQTRMLGLVFCSYAEVTFSKLIHTPHGLELDEIQQIKAKGKKDIVDAWLKCLELSTSKIESTASNHIPNIKRSINTLIQNYIKEPSLIRNKIAHGQWKVSLNRDNTAVNSGITHRICELTIVDLQRYKAAFDRLSAIMEDIIESPNKAHWKFYWQHVTEFEHEQNKMSTRTLEDKITLLKKKSQYHKQNSME
jgi:hypothetical protein